MTPDPLADIDRIWHDQSSWTTPEVQSVVNNAIRLIDSGHLRCAQSQNGEWTTNILVKKAIAVYFRRNEIEQYRLGPFEFRDRFPLKGGFSELNVRAVPIATVRFGTYVGPRVTLMPSHVNMGVWIGEDTLVDTWVSIGTCAQIGSHVTILPNASIVGALTPIEARPTIVEDDCYIGPQAVIDSGTIIGRGSIVGANAVVSRHYPIVDLTKEPALLVDDAVPPGAIIVHGTWRGLANAPEVGGVLASLIVGYRDTSMSPYENLRQAMRSQRLRQEH